MSDSQRTTWIGPYVRAVLWCVLWCAMTERTVRQDTNAVGGAQRLGLDGRTKPVEELAAVEHAIKALASEVDLIRMGVRLRGTLECGRSECGSVSLERGSVRPP